ncbi:MAG: DUF433 domain-containing protein [Acidimicrobiia bacterium]|nr:DUF433 domain-containing protein [Acidimicrobiia bacterium]
MVVTATNTSILERPTYGISEAAKHLGIRRDRIRAWLDGYMRRGRVYPPVIRPQATGEETVTWGEFVELGYLREYRRKGVSLQYLRPVIDELRNVFELPYPLATKNLYLNGHEVVWKLQVQNNLPSALAMVVRSGQMMMLAHEANSFFNKVEFDPNGGALGEARCIYPGGIDAYVRIDPLVCFGRPAIGGVATERLWELRAAGEEVSEIAADYEMPDHLVRTGVAFEEMQRVLAA